MKLILSLFVVFSLQGSAADSKPMLRFWRGFVNADANEVRLKDRLNKELLPDTIRVGKGKGLTAYLPALYAKENRPRFLPVEVALVAYSSKETYEAIRATPEGIAYGELHFVEGMFEKKTEDGYISKSEVATPFSGEVSLPAATSEAQTESVAYGIGADQIDWQKGHAFLTTLARKGANDDAAIAADTKAYLTQLESFRKQGRVSAALVLVNRKYLLSLLSFKDEAQARDFSRSSVFIPKGFEILDGFSQEKAPTQRETLEPKRLVNFQFDATLEK